jgi:hypothetical protein
LIYQRLLLDRRSVHLNTLGLVILVDAAIRALGIDTTSNWKFILLLLDLSTVKFLLEDRLLLDVLELGLEVLQASGIAATVGSATGIGKVEAFILDFLAIETPTYICKLCSCICCSIFIVLTILPFQHRSS